MEFLLTSLLVVVSPGTGALYTIAMGLARGTRLSCIAALGSTLGIVPHLLVVVTGLAAVFHTSAWTFVTIKYLGVAWLLYLAWSTLQANGTLRVEPADQSNHCSWLGVIWHAIVINILNPKLTLFFLAFLPQFIAQGDRHPLRSMLILSSIFMLMTLSVFVGLGIRLLCVTV